MNVKWPGISRVPGIESTLGTEVDQRNMLYNAP